MYRLSVRFNGIDTPEIKGKTDDEKNAAKSARDALSSLLVGGVDRPGADLAEIGRMLARLTENHTKRMAALGLAA